MTENPKASRYSALSTDRLLALADSKLHELTKSHWHGRGAGLDWLAELAGLRQLQPSSKSQVRLAEMKAPDSELQVNSLPSGPPPPLPIAAAHHPSHLRKLRKPIFPKVKTTPAVSGNHLSHPDQTRRPHAHHAEVVLSPYLDAEKRVHQSLNDALARNRKGNEDLRRRRRAKARQTSKLDSNWLELWRSRRPHDGEDGVNFEVCTRLPKNNSVFTI